MLNIVNLLKVAAMCGDHDALQIVRLPDTYRRWEASPRLPGIRNTLSNFFEREILKTKPLHTLYVKASINDESNNVRLPLKLARKSWCRCTLNEATHVIRNTKSGYRLVELRDVEDANPFTDAAYFRRPENGDYVVVIRHPVITKDSIIVRELEIDDYTRYDQDVCYVPNCVIEKLRGDFDGDSVNLTFISKALVAEESLDIEVEECNDKDVEIDINGISDVQNDDGLRPEHVSNILNIKNEVRFIETLCAYIGGFAISEDVIKSHISSFRISTLLKQIIAKPIADKAMKYQDTFGIDLVNERIGTQFTYPDGWSKRLTLDDYKRELELSMRLEQYIRMYFRSFGPKLSGYFQKVLLDISDAVIIEDDKVIFDNVVVAQDERIRNYSQSSLLLVIDDIQQRVIDLKHSYNPLENLDLAYMLRKTFERKSMALDNEKLYKFFYDVTKDEFIAWLTSNLVTLAFAKRHQALTWSYGLVSKIRDQSLPRKPWIVKPIIDLVNDINDYDEFNDLELQ